MQKVVDTAKGLEGLKRQWGVHAAGVILSREPLIDVLPIQKREQDGAIITQWDMGACESIGLLKMDFLGLRNLTVMDDCLETIKANRGVDLVLEDAAARRQADLRAAGPRRHARRVPARRRADALAAALDGARQLRGHLRRAARSTGPARWAPTRTTTTPTARTSRKPVVPIHPELAEPLAEILGDTYGLIVYQEQVMAIAQKLAGYSLGAADLLRRAMGKKKKEILDKEYVPFSRRHARAAATPTRRSRRCGTSWSRSPTTRSTRRTRAGYGLVSYWTAYLKANYPAEYMAALLTSVGDDKDKSAVYLAECRRMGIKVLPPDVNASVGPVHRGRRGHPVRPGGGAQRRHQRGRVDRALPQGEGRRTPTSTTSCARSTRSPATRRPSSR